MVKILFSEKVSDTLKRKQLLEEDRDINNNWSTMKANSSTITVNTYEKKINDKSINNTPHNNNDQNQQISLTTNYTSFDEERRCEHSTANGARVTSTISFDNNDHNTIAISGRNNNNNEADVYGNGAFAYPNNYSPIQFTKNDDNNKLMSPKSPKLRRGNSSLVTPDRNAKSNVVVYEGGCYD